MRGCEGRLRSRLGAKLLRIPPPQAEHSIFRFIAKCTRERRRASRRFSQRPRLNVFEPTPARRGRNRNR